MLLFPGAVVVGTELRLQVLYVYDEQAIQQADRDDLQCATGRVVAEKNQSVIDS